MCQTPLATTPMTQLVQPTRFHWTNMSFAVESLTATDAGAGVIAQECSLNKTVISETNETEQKKDLMHLQQ